MNSFNKFWFIALSLGCNLAFAHNLPIKYQDKLTNEQKQILEKAFQEINGLLPEAFIKGLPNNIEIKVEKLSAHTEVPHDVCQPSETTEKKKDRFIYGEYSPLTNSLKINTAVLNELKKERSNSFKINCQHKSLYDQSIATIIHELGHAFDQKNGSPSRSMEFLRRAGFKKGLLRIKNKNIEAMRSEDQYELTNVRESFAVNLEYFTMDEEFFCRRPSMFEYFKNLFGADPYPARNCHLNKSVMMSTSQGYFPISIDPARVYRIDYLMASPGKDMSSGFGHSMFRLVMCAPDRFDPITQTTIKATPFGKKCLDDKLYHMVVSYRANVEDATLNYVKGIFGGYPSMLFVLNFGDVLDEYNRDELRDVYAYPLKLSESEKSEVVRKIIEEHWNYRGSYKFFTNNCAVESIDLLKASLNRQQVYKTTSITPNGLLEDLDQIELLDRKSSEVELFKAKTEQLVESAKVAYGIKFKNNKDDVKIMQKFVSESTIDDRLNRFTRFQNEKIAAMDAHAELFELKKRLVKSSSFSVVEQQILRTVGARFKKEAADLYMNTKDPELKKKLEEVSNSLKTNFKDFSKQGYGVPLENEMITLLDINKKMDANKDSVKEVEEAFKQIMPDAFETLNAISANISKMNENSIKIRKEYRTKLVVYVHDVLVNMKASDEGVKILSRASQGDIGAMKELRNLLDPNLVSDKEIVDSKLKNMILELFT